MTQFQIPPAPAVLTTLLLVCLLLTGAIFGFFYAWVCSTMWGLDTADPAVAIAAMQAMNASVRNAVFFPAFFLTPLALLITAAVAAAQLRRRTALALAAAAVVYGLGALLVTMAVNVPMNEALARVALPQSPAEVQRIWSDYSGPWQAWNLARTVASGVALLLTGAAMLAVGRRNA